MPEKKVDLQYHAQGIGKHHWPQPVQSIVHDILHEPCSVHIRKPLPRPKGAVLYIQFPALDGPLRMARWVLITTCLSSIASPGPTFEHFILLVKNCSK